MVSLAADGSRAYSEEHLDTPLRSIRIWWEDMILPGVEDPCNCADPRNLRQSEWDQQLGKIECVFSLYDKMRWKWDDVYLLWGLPNLYSPSLCPPPLPLPVSPYTRRRSWKMCLEAIIDRVWRCTSRLRWSELRDPLGGHDRASLEMHLEAVIEGVWRCTWRPRSSELRDALGSHNWACWEIHLEAIIDHEWKSTWRQLIWRQLIWTCSIWWQSIWRQWVLRR